MSSILDTISGPRDLANLTVEQLDQLAEEMREFITRAVSQTGGHLASNLGVVEMTIALHRVFDFSRDRLVWDVGHQCYAHKILTGRRDRFDGLRQRDGLSGFPSPAESEYDPFYVGHAGTSIATALGMALGSRMAGSNEKIVACVGDASIVNGTNFEALNNLGLARRQMLVILNDNSMAIDVTQGALAKYLSRVRLSHTYEDMRKTASQILEHLPLIGRKVEDALENFKKTLRMQISPSRLFESLNIPYFGPVDGHDIESLIQLFKAVHHLDTPAILHVYTRKGKGFTPADDNPTKFHSTGPFVLDGDQASTKKPARSWTEAFSDALVDVAQRNERVVAITAAMPDGTGLIDFRKRWPDRCFDVGIAESVAVDVAAGMAAKGLRPLVCIYSTFLQRSYDHIFQEVALQNLPVAFCIDRAGLVGSDGPTHHGLTDIGFLRMMPNLEIIAPACEAEMQAALDYAVTADKSVTIRYPRDIIINGRIEEVALSRPLEAGRGVVLREGASKLVLVGLGPMAAEAMQAADELAKEGIDATVVNPRFAKPIDSEIVEHVLAGRTVITVEDHVLAGGFGAAVMEEVAAHIARTGAAVAGRVIPMGIPDEFIPAGPRKWQFEFCGISAAQIAETARRAVTGSASAGGRAALSYVQHRRAEGL